MTPEDYLLLLQGYGYAPPSDDEYLDAIEQQMRSGGEYGAYQDDFGQALNVDEALGQVRTFLNERRLVGRNDRGVEIRLAEPLANVHQLVLKLGVDAASLPLFGSLPLQRPNASVIRVPGSTDTIMAFTERLPEFANRMAKLVIEVHHGVDQSVYDDFDARHSAEWSLSYQTIVDEYLAGRPDTLQRFLQTIAAFAIQDFKHIQMHSLEGAIKNIHRTALLVGCEEFVIAHEFAHIFLEHIGTNCVVESHEIAGKDVEVVQRSQEQELEADALGYTLSLTLAAEARQNHSYYDQYLYAIRAAGATLFLAAARNLEEAQDLLPDPPERLNTHPPYEERIEVTRRQYAEITGFLPNPFSVEYEVILQLFWERTRAAFASAVRG